MPLLNNLPGRISWKIYFTEGGNTGFNRIYRDILKQIRSNRNQAELIANFNSAQFRQEFALVDPSDPSFIYV